MPQRPASFITPDDAADIAGRHLDLQTTLRGWLDVASSTVPVALLEATVNKFLDYSTQISSPVAPGETGLKRRAAFSRDASSISAACSGLAAMTIISRILKIKSRSHIPRRTSEDRHSRQDPGHEKEAERPGKGGAYGILIAGFVFGFLLIGGRLLQLWAG